MKWIIALLLICSASCNREPKVDAVALHISVKDLTGNPLPEIGVDVDNKRVGKTNEDGSLETIVSGREGRHVVVSAHCPEGFKAGPEASSDMTVRLLRPVGNEIGSPIPMDVVLICTPVSQQFALIVKTNQQKEIPIIAGGRPAGKTDLDGVAQTVLHGTIGEEIEVVLDTEDFPELLPKSPSRRIVIPETPQILVFEQDFQASKKGVRKKRRVQMGPKRI